LTKLAVISAAFATSTILEAGGHRIYLSHIAASKGGSHPGLFGEGARPPSRSRPALCAADHRGMVHRLSGSQRWPQAKLCIAQGAPADILENFESRAFPQGFLNHLETPAP
jgi:hypothetical protein